MKWLDFDGDSDSFVDSGSLSIHDYIFAIRRQHRPPSI